jgi:MFS family permease
VIVRFCLYGFLKNQRYFESFLVLALLGRGLDFTTIGGLIAAREITTNGLELVSGALADTWGRRRSMVVSYLAYMASFGVLFASRQLLPLVVAMVLYGAGDAFRSGTHKAMIFSWLRANDRAGERTRVYGTTRSWSKLGSAMSVVIGAAYVLLMDDLDGLFALALVPYAAGLVNFAGYPADAAPGPARSVRSVFAHLRAGLRLTAQTPALRGLVVESSVFLGVFKALKDYLQPVLQAAAALWIASALGGWVGEASHRKTALLVGPVFLVLYLLSAAVSRQTHRLVEAAGSTRAATTWLWAAAFVAGAVVCAGAVLKLPAALIAGLVVLYVLEAMWRPLVASRFDEDTPEEQGATVLSVESQGRSIVAAFLAPAVGYAVDTFGGAEPSYLPVGLLAILAPTLMLAMAAWTRSQEAPKPRR